MVQPSRGRKPRASTPRTKPAAPRIGAPARSAAPPPAAPPPVTPASRRPAADEPTQLTPAVASHRRPARQFQVIGVSILLLGAIIGGYTALSREAEHPVQPAAQATVLPPSDALPDPAQLWQAYTQKKAQVAAAEEAERVRKANQAAAAEAAARQQAPAPNVPASCDEYTGNRALGCAVLLEVGFSLDQMGCLDLMWTKESNWRVEAHNSSSGAHGIPQALPGSKMAAFGADWETNPVTQIRWGLEYIRSRYGTPCGAWAFWQNHHWY